LSRGAEREIGKRRCKGHPKEVQRRIKGRLVNQEAGKRGEEQDPRKNERACSEQKMYSGGRVNSSNTKNQQEGAFGGNQTKFINQEMRGGLNKLG